MCMYQLCLFCLHVSNLCSCVLHIFSVNKQTMVVAHGVVVPMRRDVLPQQGRPSFVLAKCWERSMRVQDLIGGRG
jgi:hypothetical protein